MNMNMSQRKRFFHQGGSVSASELLPMTKASLIQTAAAAAATPPASPPSSQGSVRLAPGRSQSTSAAISTLRQRGSPSSPKKRAWTWNQLSGDGHDNDQLPFYATKQPPQVLPAAAAISSSSSNSSRDSSHSSLSSSQQSHYNNNNSSGTNDNDSYYHQTSSSSSSGYHYHHNHQNYNNNYQAWMTTVLVTMTVFLVSLFGIYTYDTNRSLQHTLELRDHEIDHHLMHLQQLETRIQKLRSETVILNDQIMTLEEQQRRNEQMTQLQETKADLETQRKLFHLEHALSMVEQGIQATDRRIVREKFGHGPYYYVEMKVEFDPQSNIYDDSLPDAEDDNDTILFETAHLEDMPHSIHLFLEQVHHGLYDGTSFHRNAPHVLQAGPSISPEAHAKFRHHPSLNNVLFQEYSRETPHREYTVGYPGRPGGPDFYINVRDNTAVHGPAGQATHYSDLIADADPCFARVKSGFAVVDRIHQSRVESGGWQDAMVHPVRIVSMRVVPKEDLKDGVHDGLDDLLMKDDRLRRRRNNLVLLDQPQDIGNDDERLL